MQLGKSLLRYGIQIYAGELIRSLLDTWFRRKFRVLRKKRTHLCQRLAPFVKKIDVIGGNSSISCSLVTERCVIILDIAEFLRSGINIFMKTVHIVREFLLSLCNLLSLSLISCKNLSRIILRFRNGRLKSLRCSHRFFRLLISGEGIICCAVFRQCAAHKVNDIRSLCTVPAIEILSILMPLVKVAQLLILDMIVNFYTLFTGIFQKIRDNRRNDLILNLIHSERNIRPAAVISDPAHRAYIQLDFGTVTQIERLIAVIH